MLFTLTVIAVAAAVIALTRRIGVAVAIVAWLTATGLAGNAGVFALTGGPPRIFILPWLAIISMLLWTRTRAGRAFVENAPRWAIIALDVFRIPVELALWRLAGENLIPREMTFEGRNFDIVAGLTAIPVALIAGGTTPRPRLAIAWHVMGLLLLINVVSMAVLAAPGPLHVASFSPANTAVGLFPFVWLPAFLVPIAALTHIVGIRQALHAIRKSTPPAPARTSHA